jgi:tail tube protein
MGAGRNSYFGWVQEPTWGTPVTPPTKWCEITSENMKSIRDQEARQVVRGLHKREGNLYDRKFGVAGTVAMELNYEGLLRLVEHLTGTTPTPTIDGARREYDFTMAAGELMVGKGLTGYIFKDQTQEMQVAGMKIKSATFSMDPTRNTQVEFDYVGKDVVQVAVTAPSFPGTSNYAAGHQLTCKIDNALRAIDSAELTINNNLADDKRVVGSKQIAEPVRADGFVEITGSITVDAVQQDLTDFLAETLHKIEFLHTGAVVGTSTYKFNFQMDKCRIIDDPVLVKGPSIVKATLSYEALLPVAGLAGLCHVIVSGTETAIA